MLRSIGCGTVRARVPAVLLGIVALAVLVRVAFVLTLEDDLYWPDPHYYDEIAWRIVSGERAGDAVLRGPLQAFVMVVPYALAGHSYRAAYLFQALLGGLIPYLVFLIARRLRGSKVGLVAATIACLYPYYVYNAGALYDTQTTTILLLLVVYLALVSREAPRLPVSAAQGCALGLLALSRSIAVTLVPVAVLWTFRGERRALHAALVLALAVATVLPWTVRNHMVTGEFIPISVGGGREFLYGNSPNATATSQSRVGIPEDLRGLPREIGYAGADRMYLARGLEYVKQDPARAVRLYFAKLANLYRFYPTPQTQNRFTTVRSAWISILSYGPMFLLGLVGIVLERRRWNRYAPLLATLVTFTLVYPVFTTNVRYRLPLDGLLMVFCAVALARIASRVSPRAARWFSLPGGAENAFGGGVGCART